MPTLKRSNKRPHAAMTVHALANLSLLDTLSGAELVVYLRLIAAGADQATRTVVITNAELYSVPRRAATALRKLEDHGLVKVHYDGAIRRTIEIVQ